MEGRSCETEAEVLTGERLNWLELGFSSTNLVPGPLVVCVSSHLTVLTRWDTRFILVFGMVVQCKWSRIVIECTCMTQFGKYVISVMVHWRDWIVESRWINMLKVSTPQDTNENGHAMTFLRWAWTLLENSSSISMLGRVNTKPFLDNLLYNLNHKL